MTTSPEEEAYLERAHRSLDAARTLSERGLLEEAMSRAYYAMFYAAQALLKSEGVERRKHSAVEAVLGQHFVKTGKLSIEHFDAFSEARALREQADYAILEKLQRPLVQERILAAEAFVSDVEKLLRQAP